MQDIVVANFAPGKHLVDFPVRVSHHHEVGLGRSDHSNVHQASEEGHDDVVLVLAHAVVQLEMEMRDVELCLRLRVTCVQPV